MSNFVRDEGPLPEEALRALSYINEKDNRIAELEAECDRYREALRELRSSVPAIHHGKVAKDFNVRRWALALDEASAALKGKRENG